MKACLSTAFLAAVFAIQDSRFRHHTSNIRYLHCTRSCQGYATTGTSRLRKRPIFANPLKDRHAPWLYHQASLRCVVKACLSDFIRASLSRFQAHYITSASMFRVLRPPYTSTLLNQLRCFASYGRHTQAPYSISFDVSRPTAAIHKHITLHQLRCFASYGRHTQAQAHYISFDKAS